MGASDFPAWYSAGIFGGIGCALLCAVTIACWALWRRRAVTGGVIAALLVCLIASALDIGPLLWIEYRLSIYGPTLSVSEVGVALAAVALVGWATPLAAMCWYLLTLSPLSVAAGAATPFVARFGGVEPAPLDDPARVQPVYEGGQPWALLLAEPADEPPVELTQRLTLIGRDLSNDIVLDDERISRRHAELRWVSGRAELADYGSLNGTLVNQRSVRGRIPLREGDVIALGKRRYRLASPSAVAAASAQTEEQTEEQAETRKTPSASGSFPLGAPLRLTLTQGRAAGPTIVWSLDTAVTTIGRDAACIVALSDTSISRIHAQVTRQPAGYFISDLASSNGVFVNGQRLSGPTQIFAGDVIALGDCLLRCEEGAASVAQPAPIQANEPGSQPGGQPSAAEAPERAAPPVGAPVSSTGAPSLHMRIAPQWGNRGSNRASRPRLAPPRLAPDPRRDDASPSA